MWPKFELCWVFFHENYLSAEYHKMFRNVCFQQIIVIFWAHCPIFMHGMPVQYSYSASEWLDQVYCVEIFLLAIADVCLLWLFTVSRSHTSVLWPPCGGVQMAARPAQMVQLVARPA